MCYRKNSINVFSASFLVKERANNKTLDIILFACSEGVGKSLFRYSRPKNTEVMSICLRMSKRSYVINFSLRILPLYTVKKGQ